MIRWIPLGEWKNIFLGESELIFGQRQNLLWPPEPHWKNSVTKLTLGHNLPKLLLAKDQRWEAHSGHKQFYMQSILTSCPIYSSSVLICECGSKYGEYVGIATSNYFLFVCFKDGMGTGTCPGPPFAWRKSPYLQKVPRVESSLCTIKAVV